MEIDNEIAEAGAFVVSKLNNLNENERKKQLKAYVIATINLTNISHKIEFLKEIVKEFENKNNDCPKYIG